VAGVAILTAAALLGHDATIYANVYAHLFDDDARAAINAGNLVLGGAEWNLRGVARGCLWIAGALSRAYRRVPLTNLYRLRWPGAGSNRRPSDFQ